MQEGLRFVYVGNVPGDPGNNTYCPGCGRAVLVREGFAVREYHLNGDRCEYCGTHLPGVWWEQKPPVGPTRIVPGAPDY